MDIISVPLETEMYNVYTHNSIYNICIQVFKVYYTSVMGEYKLVEQHLP